MTDHDIELLERYVDHELAPDEVAAVEARIAEDESWSAAHVELLALRALLQDDVEAATDAADFDGFFAAVEARLPHEAPARAEAIRSPARPETEPGLWTRLRAWWGRNWTPVLIGAAVAAAVALWVGFGGGAAPDPAAPIIADGASAAPVIVDAVSNEGDKTVLISQPAGEDGATVIWLLDEEQQAAPAPKDGEDPI